MGLGVLFLSICPSSSMIVFLLGCWALWSLTCLLGLESSSFLGPSKSWYSDDKCVCWGPPKHKKMIFSKKVDISDLAAHSRGLPQYPVPRSHWPFLWTIHLIKNLLPARCALIICRLKLSKTRAWRGMFRLWNQMNKNIFHFNKFCFPFSS